LRRDFPRNLAVLGALSRAPAGRARRCPKSMRKIFRKSGAFFDEKPEKVEGRIMNWEDQTD
jgi:hypothetical protein